MTTAPDPSAPQHLDPVSWDGLIETPPLTPSEDFSFFQEKIPGLYFFLGVNDEGVGLGEAASNHSPLFYVNEDVLPLGVRALSTLVVDYLQQN